MKNGFKLLLIIAGIIISACNNDGATGDTNHVKDTTIASGGTNELSFMTPYDAAMDPMNVEAKFMKKIADTLDIKLYEITLNPGDSAELHTHPDYTLYVLEGGKIAITVQGQGRQEVDLQKGMGLISGSHTHSGKNIGNTPIKLLVHDIYRPRRNQ